MAVARVVAFDGVSSERVEQLRQEMSEGERPEGMPSAEVLMLHDPESERSLVILILETEDDYFEPIRKYHGLWKLYGLGLPDDVLKKLYYKNAIRVAKGMPTAGWPQ